MNQGWSLKSRMTVEIFMDTHQQNILYSLFFDNNIIYYVWQTSKD